MTLKRNQVQPQQDPGLVELFKGSKRSYNEDVDDLITRLDQSAAFTRAHRNQATTGRPAVAQAVGVLADGSRIIVHDILPARESLPLKAAKNLSAGKLVADLPKLTATDSKESSPSKAKTKSKAH